MIARIRDSRISRIGRRIARGSVISPEEYITTFGNGGWPGSLDDYQWALGDIQSSCILDWRGGDGENPTIGDAFSLNGVGLSDEDTPLYLEDGTNLKASYFAGDTFLQGTQDIFPNGFDWVVLIVCSPDKTNVGMPFSSGNASSTNFINFFYSSGVLKILLLSAGSYTFTSTVSNGFTVCLFVNNQGSGKMRSFFNSLATSEQPSKSLSLANRTNIGTQYTSAASQRFTGYIARIAVYRGSGIASGLTPALAERNKASIFGIVPNADRDVVFSRSGIVTLDDSNGSFTLGNNAPSIHNTNGIYLPTACTNKAYKNLGIVAGDSAILTVTGGMTVSDVAVDFKTYNLHGFGQRAFQVANTTGSTQYVYYGATVGAPSNKHSCSVRAHHTAGSGGKVGVYCPAGFDSAANISNNFGRSHGIVTPLTGIKRWALEVPNNATIQFIMANLVDQDYQAPEIGNVATAATAALGASTVEHGCNLEDAKMQLEAEIAPEGWAGGTELGTRKIITDSVSAGQHLVINDTTQNVVIDDGTNNATAAIVEADGVYKVIQSSWGAKGLKAKVGATEGTASYDGAIGAGVAQTESCNRRVKYTKMKKSEI